MPGLEGTTLGRYQLMRKLGRGGMSEVYLAHDERMNRDVAIKVVSSSHTEYSERFRRETEALGNLQHDHILPAYDYGEQGPYQYLVMPYEAHGTLSDLLREGPLSLEHAGELLDQIASGLDYAHERGIIHRDIKPSNILLRDDHYVYLADFGLVKAMEGSEEQNLTQTGTLLGTPEYMAPELSEGPANTGTDVYALAILLYQMITGRVPFLGDTPLSVYFKQLRDHALLPSYVNPDIPLAVDQVLMRALDKDPGRRYATAGDLADAYHAAITGLEEMPSLYDTSEMAVDDAPALAVQPPMQERKLFLSAEPLADAPPTAVQAAPLPVAPVTPVVPSFNDPTVHIPSYPAASPIPPASPVPQVPPTTPPLPMQSPRVTRRSARYRGRQSRLMVAIITAGLFLLLVSLFLLILALNRPSAPSTQAAQTETTAVTATSNTAATATPQATSTGAASAQATQQAATATAGVVSATSTVGVAATSTASAQATQQAIAATATAATSGTPALDDPLASNTNGRWPDDGNACSFLNGTYHVLVHQTDFFQPCVSNVPFADAAIEINVSLLSGNDAGLLFRASGQRFYDFEINNQGKFFFRRHDAGGGGVYTYIIPETVSNAIAGGQSNTLLVIANGSDFKLFINGTFVGERQDSTYSSGQVGVAAGTLNPTSSAEGSFSNLKVYKV